MKKAFFLFFIFLFVSLFPIINFAQQAEVSNNATANMEKEAERIRQDAAKAQQQELESLKRKDPKLYQERKESLDRQVEINNILVFLNGGNITATQAEKELYPLVKKDVQSYIANLGNEITRLEKKLQFLKDVKRDPDILIDKRIKQLLGKSATSDLDF